MLKAMAGQMFIIEVLLFLAESFQETMPIPTTMAMLLTEEVCSSINISPRLYRHTTLLMEEERD